MRTKPTPDRGHFLNVARSLSGRSWRPRLADDRLALAIAQKHALPEVLGRVLAGRGIAIEDAERHLRPTLRELMPATSRLNDLEPGAERLAHAVRTGEHIGVIGDYDVDGISSVAILVRFLRSVGSGAEVHIPDRIQEGYGPSRLAVESLKARGVSLLVTVDCGVMAHDPLLLAGELGMDTLIVDHHQASAELPRAHAVINPNRLDDLSGLGYLSAVGVTFALLAATNRLLRASGWYGEGRSEPDLLALLDLVALGSVCDVVPLTGLNRAYVAQGLRVMASRGRIGIAALADVARLRRPPDTYALGYLLGPRLNAAGRIGHAMRALELLLAEDRGSAMMIAMALEKLNRERQEIELRIVEQAGAQAEAMLGREQRAPALVVAGEGWHPGVLGLVASRLKERFYLPSIALSFAKGSDMASGSGRSIPGVDLGAAVRDAVAAGIIERGGGHAMAAGLTIQRFKLGTLRQFLEERLGDAVAASRLDMSVAIDGALSARAATLDLVELLDRAGPFGTGNPSPVFVFPAHRIVYADGAGSDHVRCSVVSEDGARLKAIAFRALSAPLGERLLSERQQPLHVAGRLAIDDYNGGRQVQLMIDDAAEVGSPDGLPRSSNLPIEGLAPRPSSIG